MGRLDWARACFVMQGSVEEDSGVSKADQIMAKYRPIAPKPSLQTPSSLGKPTSDSPLHFISTFNPTHNMNSCARSGYKRRTQPHSTRHLKKSRGEPSSGIPSTNPDVLLSRVQQVKPNGISVLVERSDELVSTNVNPVSKVDDVSVDKVSETHSGSGSGSGSGSAVFFVFPIVGEEEKNLVTLPFLPPTPQLQWQNVSSHSSPPASSNKQGIPLRLFGRDLGYKEVGSCQISNNESPEPEKVVPVVGLSFI